MEEKKILSQLETTLNDHNPPESAILRNEPVSLADPFDDLDALRLGQDFSAALGKRMLTTFAVRKPGKQDFIRVRPEPEFRLETFILELKEDREVLPR